MSNLSWTPNSEINTPVLGPIMGCLEYQGILELIVAEWLRAWDTLTMFEATVCGRS